MTMKHLFLLLTTLLLMSCGSDKTIRTTQATEAPIRWVGRTLSTENGVKFDWSGTYADLCFEGNYLEIILSDTGRNFLNWTLDGKEQAKLMTQGDSMKIVLVNSPEEPFALHHIRLQKATEGEQGLLTIHALRHNGELKAVVESSRPRHIEFFGDSLTAGYGTESESGNEPFSVETENCRYTHAVYMAEYFGADYNLVAFSGRGMVRNYGDQQSISDSLQTMYCKAFHLFSCSESDDWDFEHSPYCPDAVVIMLSTNDFSTKPHPDKQYFSERYRQFILNIRRAYHNPTLPILCAVHSPHAVKAVSQAIEGLEQVMLADVSGAVYNSTTERGASMHPNRLGQQRMAEITIPLFHELTGWEPASQSEKME